jgi:uncharacterized protein (TIGR02246 family)
MKARVILAACLAAIAGLMFALAGQQRFATAGDNSPNDEEGIRKAMQAYVAAFNKGDLEGVMSYWASDAEFISDDGKATRGRDAIAAQTKRVFGQHEGLTIKLVSKSIRFVKPDVALQDGIVTLSAQDKPADSGPYTAVWTKVDGKWLLNSVRDLPDSAPVGAGSNYGALKQLEWLIGHWTSEDKDANVTLSFRWDKNQNFLVMEQNVNAKGENVVSLTQIIGWDPLQQQLRSWLFDSHGGFGESYWTRRGNSWDVNSAGVLNDGRTTSSVNNWKYIDDRTLEWQSTERQIDDQPMPELKIRYQKKAGKD